MWLIAVGIFAGGAAVISAGLIQKRNKKRLVVLLSAKVSGSEEKPFGRKVSRQSPGPGKWVAHLGNLLVKLDSNYQKFVVEHIDPLFAGKDREQFFKDLSAGRQMSLSSDQKSINRKIVLGIVSLGLIGLGYITGTRFTPVVIAIGVYLSLPVYKISYEIAVEERRLSTIHLIAIYFTVLWLGGYYAIGTLSFLLGGLSQKVMRICEDTSRYELANVFYQQPRSVWILQEGTEMQIPFNQLQAGNTLVLDVGQTIPVDGVIVSGMASIDQHRLTGESLPVDKAVGDTVLAATLVLGGRIFVRVEKAGEETSAAEIGKILNRRNKHQLSVESRAIKIADRTLVPMLAISAASLPFAGLRGAIAVLGSNFTMNMVWLRLLTQLNVLNAASKRKILVKEGEGLERLKKVDTVVFDKTGTLTTNQPYVVGIHRCGKQNDEDILALAAAAEHRQVHPVAKAILAAAKERQLTLPPVDDAQYEIGFGIKVKLQGQWICVGSRLFMDEENIEVPAAMQELEKACSTQGHSLVYVVVEGRLAGLIELKATIRPEATKIVRCLQERGIKPYIISGDSARPTKALAEELGIDGCFAETLPDHKAKLIKQLQTEGHTVCFVGDGINDALALRQADVSISLNGATTLATDTAQIILMDADLKQLLTLFDLSHALDGNINRNSNWAMLMSLVSVGGIVFFHTGFLMVELLAGLQAFRGIAIASQPLLDVDDAKPNET